MSLKVVCLLPVCMLIAAAPAMGFVIDGYLTDDWGVSVADNNASKWQFLPTINLIGSHIEDQDDKEGDSGWLGPNAGGQKFDAEMMAVAVEGNTLYMAIVSGQRPDNGFQRFSPGDIRIETDFGTYGIEVGGGKGGLAGSLLTEGMAGSTYKLNANGYTTQYADAHSKQTAGSIWYNVNWLNDPIKPYEPVQFEIEPAASVLMGMADFAYTRDSFTSQHSVIELAFNLEPFAGQTLQSVHWRPGCGNDELDVVMNMHVPEPASALGLLLLAALVLRKRRRVA